MPRPPRTAPALAALHGNPYSSLLGRMATHRGEVFPLHVGDTWRKAPSGCRPEELGPGLPGVNRYTDVSGPAGAARRDRRSRVGPDGSTGFPRERPRDGRRDGGPDGGRGRARRAGRGGPSPRSALAAHRGARPSRGGDARRGSSLHGRSFAGGRRGGRARARDGEDCRGLREHAEQPDGPDPPAPNRGRARARRAGGEPLAPRGRGLRALRVRRPPPSRVRRGARAHRRGAFALEGVGSRGRRAAAGSSGPRPRSPRS